MASGTTQSVLPNPYKRKSHLLTLPYRADGLSFVIDLGTGKWHATIEESQFKGGMAPRDGAIRVELLLGGKRVSDQTLTLERWKTALTYPYTTPR